jgi:hypothetical protein
VHNFCTSWFLQETIFSEQSFGVEDFLHVHKPTETSGLPAIYVRAPQLFLKGVFPSPIPPPKKNKNEAIPSAAPHWSVYIFMATFIGRLA